MIFRTGLAVALFNIFLFFVSVEIACTIPGVDRYRLVFLLALCSETAPALVTLNKEILVLLSTLSVGQVYLLGETFLAAPWQLVLFISLFARWEQIALILLFLFLQQKRLLFSSATPSWPSAHVIGVLTVLYGLIARLPGIGSRSVHAICQGRQHHRQAQHNTGRILAFRWYLCPRS